MAKVSVGFDAGVASRQSARVRVVEAVIAVLEEAPDQSLVVSSLRLANLCGLSWGGNRGTAEALRRLTGVQS
jgi:hypothetical protein